jgi:hypothetical protein
MMTADNVEDAAPILHLSASLLLVASFQWRYCLLTKVRRH